jgi:hypothetical protein
MFRAVVLLLMAVVLVAIAVVGLSVVVLVSADAPAKAGNPSFFAILAVIFGTFVAAIGGVVLGGVTSVGYGSLRKIDRIAALIVSGLAVGQSVVLTLIYARGLADVGK